VERTPSFLGGQPTTRLIFIYRAMGCAYGRRPDGGCTNCGFASLTTGGVPVTEEDLNAQLDAELGRPGALHGVGEVNLYNSGSFLSDQEIPPGARAHAMRRLRGTGVRRILVEGRPEHVSVEKLRALKALLGDEELEVGVGLESADDHVREVLVNKGFTRADFEGAVARVGQAGCRLLAYVLVKPMGVTEREAVEDAVASAAWVHDVASRHGVEARVALQPTFVAPGTKLERAFLAGRYQPPSLWSVVEVVRRAHPHGALHVGLSDEGLEPRRVPAGCPRCTETLRAALREYNRTHDVTVLGHLSCACRPA
jgi:hypothetical protein